MPVDSQLASSITQPPFLRPTVIGRRRWLPVGGVRSALVLSARCRAEPVEEDPKNQLAYVIR
jgi:hypothetical protein